MTDGKTVWRSAMRRVLRRLFCLVACVFVFSETSVAGDVASHEHASDGATHWAFVPPVRPQLPTVNNPSWVRNPIDIFVLSRLEADGLTPSSIAGQVTLLRRLSLDLIGLPPSIDEIDSFLADDREDAYERQVERLLHSPHYGEKWGRHWLDAARYADSNGYEKDLPRFVWAYRDWVIQAFNRDLAYDQFIIEQIAGDMLPDASQDQYVATGFLRNSMINEEGGIDPEEFRFEAMLDRMETIGKSILGLTIQCCQCHDHKYDPLTQREYYGLFAFLNNAHEATIPVFNAEEQARRNDLLQCIQSAAEELQRQHPDWRQRMAAWEASLPADPTDWTVIIPYSEQLAAGPQKYHVQSDGSLLACGYSPTGVDESFQIETDQPIIHAIRLELLTDGDLPFGGPGRSYRGTVALSEIRVEAAPLDNPTQSVEMKIASATADITLPEKKLDPLYGGTGSDEARITGPVEFAIDGRNSTAWGIDVGPVRRNQPRKAVFVLQEPIQHPNGTLLTVTLGQHHGHRNEQNQNLGRFRISISPDPDAMADPIPIRVREVQSVPTTGRTAEQVRTLFSYWRNMVAEWRDTNDLIDQWWRQLPEGSSTQLVLLEREDPRRTHLLERGDFLSPGERIDAGVPALLHQMPSDPRPSRLSFARWLVDDRSPTTARSIVNRIWQSYFGTGLLQTSEDFGVQAGDPSHLDLLDWLSVELMQRGWSLKALHRLIVTSATYRQSSDVSPEWLARDPGNRLLARAPRFRVEAETVRDIALAASGLLRHKVGGPSVFPSVPEFLLRPPISHAVKSWNVSTGADRYRRALYTFRFRTVMYPMLQTFDAPSGESSCIRRERSNTPLQALTTLNEQVFMECARSLAQITLIHGGDTDEQRLVYAFRRCVARQPTEEEAGVLAELLDHQKQRFQEPDVDPWQLAAHDPAAPPRLPGGATPVELAAWTAVSRVLLNLDETITKQ